LSSFDLYKNAELIHCLRDGFGHVADSMAVYAMTSVCADCNNVLPAAKRALR